MSRKNIRKIDELPNGGVRVTFDTPSGPRHYEYGQVAAKGIKDGKDPSGYRHREVKIK